MIWHVSNLDGIKLRAPITRLAPSLPKLNNKNKQRKKKKVCFQSVPVERGFGNSFVIKTGQPVNDPCPLRTQTSSPEHSLTERQPLTLGSGVPSRALLKWFFH